MSGPLHDLPGLDSCLDSGLERGLDASGRIRREGSLGLVADAFRPLVAELEPGLRHLYGARLHSVYLYGSVPRGTAVVGRSDLDVTAVLTGPVSAADRAAAGRWGEQLDAAFAVVDEVGILVEDRALFLAADQRFDAAFHLSCLCTPLCGPDLAELLPAQYPTLDLAAGIPGDVAAAFGTLAARLDAGGAGLDLVRQRIGRRIARLAFCCVLARWPGWSSDPEVMARVVTAGYPDRAAELQVCVRLGWGRLRGTPPVAEGDHRAARWLLAEIAPWWLAEHRRVTARRDES